MPLFQFQFGGHGNIQILQQVAESFPRLLNQLEGYLKERGFESEEVKARYHEFLTQAITHLNDNKEHTFSNSRYIVFPFKTLPEDEILRNQAFLQSMLDTVTIMAFSEHEFEIREHRINIRINGKQIFGVYFQQGTFNLIENYTKLLRAMVESKEILPSEFVCIILNSIGEDRALDEQKIKNIVTNIMGDSDYIRPLNQGNPKCINLTSYVIQQANSVEAAKQIVREVLSL